MKLIVKSEGLQLYGYWIPPFELKSGILIDLWLPGNSAENDYVGSKIEKELIQLLTGNKPHTSLKVEQPLKYVDHFMGDNFLKARFWPTTPERYLKQNGRLSEAQRQELLESLHITYAFPLNRYGGNTRKLLSLWATLSKSKNILFDTYAIDPFGVEAVYSKIEEEVLKGGSAIELNMPDIRGKRDQSKLAETVIIQQVNK